MNGGSGALFKYPELDTAVIAFFLHFVWEFWQMPWYAEIARVQHLDGVIICTQATFGDVAITLAAYLAVTLAAKDRYWAIRLTTARVAGFLVIGLAITVVLEWLATKVFDRWQYADAMWTVPVLGTGLAPTLQWIFVPMILLLILGRLWAR
ncbi:MAG: hypothetical protein ACI915_002973 [Gammaproteobacteria bacterium]|jgi:hypothetical protein